MIVPTFSISMISAVSANLVFRSRIKASRLCVKREGRKRRNRFTVPFSNYNCGRKVQYLP